MSNPFDWRNEPSKINLKEFETSRRTSYQASRAVNEIRKRGIEPSSAASLRTAQHITADPAHLAIDMPKMATRKTRRKKT
jgi:hypothetical protein